VLLGWSPSSGNRNLGQDLTREQFEALPPDALIDLNGERITKHDFLARTTKALEEATQRSQEANSRAEDEFEQRRKTFIDDQNAALAEANEKINRLVAADTSAHGADWLTRKKQAAELINQAENAPPGERSRLEKGGVRSYRWLRKVKPGPDVATGKKWMAIRSREPRALHTGRGFDSESIAT